MCEGSAGLLKENTIYGPGQCLTALDARESRVKSFLLLLFLLFPSPLVFLCVAFCCWSRFFPPLCKQVVPRTDVFTNWHRSIQKFPDP